MIKFHDRKKYLNKVILNNSKADIISEKCIRTNKYRIHLDSNKNSLRRKFNNYTSVYKYPYMNNEEKYQREKYLDKKNWLNKQGFIIYSKDKSKDNFIPLGTRGLRDAYENTKKLGKGSFGKVFQVRNKTTNKFYACKKISKLNVNSAQFQKEINIIL